MRDTRHYIGLTDLGRLHMQLDADDPAEFTTPPTEPVTREDGVVLYPVSAEVADEWVSHDEDDEALPEIECPSCSATIRARLADQPGPRRRT